MSKIVNKHKYIDIKTTKLWEFIISNNEKNTSRQTHMWFGTKGDRKMFRVEDNEYDHFIDLL
jgi:hypothetical protein